MAIPSRWLNPLILVLTVVLSSCGGGSNTSGAGGSGIGGTGITTVTGNVSQVISEAPQEEQALARRMLAGAVEWLAAPVNAQSARRGGIQVFAGGQVTTTEEDGSFTLEDVAPNDNFVLNFVFEDNQTIALPIGAVPPGSRVEVRNVVVDTTRGIATPEEVEIEEVVDTSNAGNGNNSGRNGNRGNSDNPGNPGNPGNLGNPDNPGQSGNRGNPGVPGQEGSPGNSGNSDNPGQSGLSTTPDTPAGVTGRGSRPV